MSLDDRIKYLPDSFKYKGGQVREVYPKTGKRNVIVTLLPTSKDHGAKLNFN